jgi:nitrate reductase NapA
MYTSLTNRRSFIKKMAVLSAMTAAATMFPGIMFADEQESKLPKGRNLEWKKAPCRFCGVGCGVLIGLEKGKAQSDQRRQANALYQTAARRRQRF